MEVKKQIQIIYWPGTWGNTLRWLLDRFTANSKFKDMSEPWDEDGRVHGFNDSQYNDAYARAHQVDGKDDLLADAKKIVIGFGKKDFLFVERCLYFRHPDFDTPELLHKNVIRDADQSFVRKTFGDIKESVSVTKELLKIRFHDHTQINWWQNMTAMMDDENNHKFDLQAMWNKKKLGDELQKISDSIQLNLQIDQNVLDKVTGRVAGNYVVKTRNRANDIITAIANKDNVDCGDLDIVEQAYIETVLEKENDSLLFPYGTNWFADTKQINDFIYTYPKYLRHMNPRLPWYNNVKNPFHLTGQIDRSKKS